MTFHGWTDAALDFYEGLEVDNSKTYWQSHKNVYDEQVAGPMRALLDELSDEFGEANGPTVTSGSAPTRAPTRPRPVPPSPDMATCSSPPRGSQWPAAPTSSPRIS